MNHGFTQQRSFFGLILAVFGASFFALSLTTARYTYDYGTNVQTIMLIRFLCLTIIMFIWNRAIATSLVLPKTTLAKCILLAIFYYIGIGSYLASVAYIPASLAVLILYTFPILVILLNALLERKLPKLLLFVALVIAFLGLFIALDINGTNLREETSKSIQMIGLAFAVSAAIGVTLNMVGSASLLTKIPFTVFSFYQALVITFISIVMLTLSGGIALPNELNGWYGLLTMLVSFTIAYISVYSALKLIGAVRTSTVMNLEPIITTLFAIALLGEYMTVQKLIGGFIVLVAIILAQWPQLSSVIFKSKT